MSGGGGKRRGTDDEAVAVVYEEGEVEKPSGRRREDNCDDDRLDPDWVAYVDKKLQDVLGHFQKDFEGGVLAENLGSQYGGYGSFLPTYQRSPSVVSQSRSPAVPPNSGSASRSPYVPVESVRKSHFVKSVLDSRRKDDHCLRMSDGINGNLHQYMLNRAVNGPDKKAPKIRIKLNSNISLERNTAAIYSGLGLDISPSSSMDDSINGSAEVPEPTNLPYESPKTILQIMTCHSIPGGILLSPLAENILELRKKSPPVTKNVKAHAFDDKKAELNKAWSDTTSAARDKKYPVVKKIKYDEKKDHLPDMKSSKRRHTNSIMNKATLPELYDMSDIDSFQLSRSGKTEQHPVENSEKMVSDISNHLKETKNVSLTGRISDKSWLRDIESIVDVKAVNLMDDDNHPKGKANLRPSTMRNAFEVLSRDSKKASTLDEGLLGKINFNPDECNDQYFTTSSHLPNAFLNNASLERDKGKVGHVKDELSQHRAKEKSSLVNAESMNIVIENVGRNPSVTPTGKTKISSVQTALSRKKLKIKAHKQLNYGITRNSCGEDTSVKPEKETASSGETDKGRSGGRDEGDRKISPMIVDRSASVPPACTNGTTISSVAVPVAEPVLINEEWVCCDKCEKWRLLPYGMNPDILPKKWRCSMLSWLPGMNSCKVSEDETTKELRALYMVPATENNTSLDGHTGTGTVGAHTKSIATSGKLKVGSCDIANVSNNLSMVETPKPSKKLHAPTSINPESVDCFRKHKEKRKHIGLSDKGETDAGDWPHPKLKSSVGVDHGNLRASKKMKKTLSESAKHRPCKFEISKSSPSIKESPKDLHQHSGMSPSTGKYGSSSLAKCNKDKKMSDGCVITSVARSVFSDLSTETRKSKQRQLSKRSLDPLAGDAFVKQVVEEALSENNGAKDKPRSELKFVKTDDGMYAEKEFLSEQHRENIDLQHSLLSESSTRKNVCYAHAPIAATSSSSKVSSCRKSKVDFQEIRASPVESISSSPLQTSDKNLVDQLKRYPCAVAENVHSQESGQRGSPLSKEKYDLACGSDSAKPHVSGDFNGGMHNHVLKDGELQKDRQELLTDECIKNEDSGRGIRTGYLNSVMVQKANPHVLSKHEKSDDKQQPSHQNGKAPSHFNSNQSDHEKVTSGKHLTQVKPDKGNIERKDLKINPCIVKGNKQQPSLNNTTNGNVSYNYKAKPLKKAVTENMKQATLNGDANPINTSDLLKEARDLKHLSKRLKEKGDDFESASMCFEAALKFLHVASLLEAPNTDCSIQGVTIQAMRLYSETGNLCGFCAREFERLKKMANAALAYKCVEVAYMNAAFYKQPGAIKDKHALQATSLMVPPAESPSSSASDVDNFNYQSTATKAVSARALCSPRVVGNSLPRDNRHLMGLLAYAEDMNYAFDGTRKSQSSFSTYVADTEKSQVDGIALVREVLEFSFHNVKGLLQLIRHCLESISHENGIRISPFITVDDEESRAILEILCG